jgi:hypothetical protein
MSSKYKCEPRSRLAGWVLCWFLPVPDLPSREGAETRISMRVYLDSRYLSEACSHLAPCAPRGSDCQVCAPDSAAMRTSIGLHRMFQSFDRLDVPPGGKGPIAAAGRLPQLAGSFDAGTLKSFARHRHRFSGSPTWASHTAEKLASPVVLKGHGFSRADNCSRLTRAFSPAE